MADGIFNISKGGFKQYAELGAANDALVLSLIETSGLEADATLVDHDTLSALYGAANNEPAGGTYVRKSITSATVTVDDTNNRLDVDVADQTWTGLTTTGNAAISKAVFSYDGDTTAGTDANIIPVSHHDFVITPDGSDVTLQVAAAGLLRAA